LRLSFVLVLSPLGHAVACQPVTETEDSGGTCSDYKDTICAYSSECGFRSWTTPDCNATIGPLECVSERLASDCYDALVRASCTDPPNRCDLVDVLVRTAAMDACDELHHRLCSVDERCGRIYDVCRDEAALALPCGGVVVVSGDPEACYTALDGMQCADAVPASCEGLFPLN
jgi:hypothetical protein